MTLALVRMWKLETDSDSELGLNIHIGPQLLFRCSGLLELYLLPLLSGLISIRHLIATQTNGIPWHPQQRLRGMQEKEDTL
jgi:hypothetical protein